MATETGVINEVMSQTTGTIIRDNGFDPNPVSYNDQTLASRQIVLLVGDFVTYDIDTNNVVSNVALTPAADPGVTTISVNTTGNPFVDAGQTLNITGGAVITGSVTLNGGTLNIGQGSTITGNIVAINGSSITIDTATIGGDVDMFDGTSYKSSHGTNSGDILIKRNKSVVIANGTHQGDVNIKKSALTQIGGTTINGDVKIKRSAGVSVTNNTVNGDLILKNNTPPCTDTGNKVTGKYVPC